MRLYDCYTEQELTLADLKNDWKAFREEDPENHSDSFIIELYEIIMATINGRNDYDLVGITAAETVRMIDRMTKSSETLRRARF